MTTTAFERPSATTIRNKFAQYPSGVAALAATVDGEAQVLVASSFTVGVSLEPPLVMFAVQNSSSTWPILRRASQIGVSILAHDQGTLCRQLASKDTSARFADATVTADGDAIHIGGAAGHLTCKLVAEHPAGDHTIAVLEVEGIDTAEASAPLVFHASRFTRLES